MPGETIVFYAKYTTLVEGVYYSDPYDVTGYKTIVAETMYVAGIAAATVTGQMEQSSDMITWSNFGSTMAPSVGTADTEIEPDPVRYIRLKMTIGASGGVATIWAKAVARDS